MKKKLGIILFLGLLLLVLTSCDEVLSVITVDENGKKVVNSYVSTMGNTVYDESISFNEWRDVEVFGGEDIEAEEILFKIENIKENRVVLGDKESAVEITFFDGGYEYKIYTSMESMSNSMGNLFD